MPPTPLAPGAHLTKLEHVPVQDLMTPSPVSVRHGITVRAAAAFLADRGIGAAPVVNDAGRAVGILSRSDVLLAVTAGVDGAPVREVMTPSVIGIRPDATALEACNQMVRHLVRRVFVLDAEGVPVGVVSTTDLLRRLSALWDEPAPVAVVG
jgi:predicted transcriptional regulator